MTAFLPPNLLALFAPREPVPYLPPVDKLPHEKKVTGYSGVSEFLTQFEDPKDTPAPVKAETRDERQERKRKEKAEQMAYKLEQEIALWSAQQETVSETEAFRTLFVARVSYETTESKLRREFEEFGPIKKITMINDQKTGKPRGYAFIEYESARDMHAAYKHADGRKIDARRVLVDVERGHTIKGWLPRRLGGGLGGTRRGGPDVNIKVSGREDGYGKAALDRDRFGGGRSPSPVRDRGLKPRDRDRGDRDRDRDRDRGDRDRRRDRDRGDRDRRPGDEERRRRSRSRDKDRDRRDRDRDRRRGRSRSRDRRRDRRGDRMREDMDMRIKTDIKDEPDGGFEQYAGPDGGGGFGGGFTVKKEPKEYYDNQEGQYGFNAQDY